MFYDHYYDNCHICRGILCASIIFLLVQAAVESKAEGTVPIFSQIPQYLVLSLAEALVSVTSLAYAYLSFFKIVRN